MQQRTSSSSSSCPNWERKKKRDGKVVCGEIVVLFWNFFLNFNRVLIISGGASSWTVGRGRGSEEEEGISSPLGVVAGFAAAGTSTSIATLISSIYVNKYKIYVLVKILVSGKIT